jgi:hypothetical protein
MPVVNFFARNLASICRNILKDAKRPKRDRRAAEPTVVFFRSFVGRSFMRRAFSGGKWATDGRLYGKSRHQASTPLRIVGQLAYNDFEPRINGLLA